MADPDILDLTNMHVYIMIVFLFMNGRGVILDTMEQCLLVFISYINRVSLGTDGEHHLGYTTID